MRWISLGLFLLLSLYIPVLAQNANNPTGGGPGCASFSPTDQSGGSLTFTAVSVQFCRDGNLVFLYGTITYPSTADVNGGKISLPVAVPNQSYAGTPGTIDNTGVAGSVLMAVKNSSTAAIIGPAGTAISNTTLSTKVITFSLVYPAS